MFFKVIALAMCGIVATFMQSVDAVHAVHAALLPATAALGIYLLAST